MADTTPVDPGTQIASFPPALAASMLKVMAALDTLAKDHEKTGMGGTYKYASIDDFIGHVRPHRYEQPS